jgi:AraC-like DNA-binding protein
MEATALETNRLRMKALLILGVSLRAISATPLVLAIGDAVVRLLECLRSPIDAAVLGPGIVREILYRVICGPRGGTLLGLVNRGGQLARMHEVLGWIHRDYAEPLSVPRMAEKCSLSVSAFHRGFKDVTGPSPMQYLKDIRLHKARLSMACDGLGASAAAARVGYESPSQLSRELKRFFGTSPARASGPARVEQE